MEKYSSFVVLIVKRLRLWVLAGNFRSVLYHGYQCQDTCTCASKQNRAK